MRYHVPVFVREHHDGRFTLSLVDPSAEVFAHGGTRAEAEESFREAIAARIRDLDDPLGDQLRHEAEREIVKLEVGVRVRHGSGRREEVALRVSSIVVTPRGGTPEIVVPRLGLSFEAPSREDALGAIRDEVRSQLAGATDDELLALVPDEKESLATLLVDAPPRERIRPRKRKRREEDEGALARAGLDLTETMKRGGPVRAHAREAEVQALLSAVSATPPASVLLVGPSGAGKTAIVHEAARRIALELAPKALEGARVFYLSGNRIIAGMRYLGDWEERCVEIVEDARSRNAIVFVDDLAELCLAGRTDERDAGVARFFAPFVQRGELVLVAEATPERIRRVERIDASILALFRRIEVRELSSEDTLEILRRASGALAKENEARIVPTALEACLDLTRRFMPGRRLPGKAVALLERTVENTVSRKKKSEIARDQVIAEFTRETGLPEVVLRDDLALDRDELARDLGARVLEQPQAAAALADAVVLAKAGLNDPKKPVAVYLFVGPTGVGKTESARVLAERLFGSEKRLVRFDMSEYQDAQGYLRLAGSEGTEGELPRKIREQPFSVLLLDEIEKAHESVFDMLLSVLGEGRLVDHGGRTADFTSSIVIMTSNLGTGDPEQVGFQKEGQAARDRFRAAAEAFFRPELLNRIDRIVPFGMLSRGAIEAIARRELEAVSAREGLERRNVTVSFAPELVSELARAGWHPRFGARPLKREVERRVLTPLARHLVRRRHEKGASIEVWLRGESVRVSARDRSPPRTARGEFYELERPLTRARIVAGLSTVRVRFFDLEESWVSRAACTKDGGAALLSRLAALGRALAETEARVEALASSVGKDGLEPLARKLEELDRETTELELACLIAVARPRPLATLRISEGKAAQEPGAARELLASGLARWAQARKLGVHREDDGRSTLLSFADPAGAGLLALEEGIHEFGIDFRGALESLRGARVRVGDSDAPVRSYGGTPSPWLSDPATGLRQSGDVLDLGSLDRFLVGRLRLRAHGM